MLNIEKYSKQIWRQMEEEGDDLLSAFYEVIGRHTDINVYDDDVLFEWMLLDEDKNAVLDKEEKNYLRSVIKPFKNKVTNIVKELENYITIVYLTKEGHELTINLPIDSQKFMKMEEDKFYTVDELGL